jgi:hypothetical protein
MQLKRVAVSTFLLGLSVYILLPTADEIVIHPVFGFLLSNILNLPLAYGILLSIAIYRGIGSACLIGALFVGGKPIFHRLKDRISRKRKSNI